MLHLKLFKVPWIPHPRTRSPTDAMLNYGDPFSPLHNSGRWAAKKNEEPSVTTNTQGVSSKRHKGVRPHTEAKCLGKKKAGKGKLLVRA